MSRKISLIAISLLVATAAMAAQPLPLTEKSIDKVIAALTLEEKAHLVVGARMSDNKEAAGEVGYTRKIIPGAAGTTYPVERLGITPVVVADGPAGLRIAPTREGDTQTYYCTGFPVGTHLASTWNDELIRRVGAAIGEEVREYGVDVLLAPGVNIMRNPLCGRNFEYYSEDPLLAGNTAAAMINGVESNGVGTSLKHFAVNSQEINRLGNDSRLSPRALYEIYLRNFEIAVRKAQPWTIMTSYNYINGTHAAEHRVMLEDVLRKTWGFEGLVMSDWGGGYIPEAMVAAGNDLIMPGKYWQYENIVKAVKEGRLAEADLDRSVRRLLELVVRTPRFKGYKFSNKPDMKAHAALTREVAAEGFVLLKNESNALPLASRKVALFGATSYNFIAGGAGSGDVHRPYVVDLRDGLLGNGFTLYEPLDKLYSQHIAEEKARIVPQQKLRKWYLYALRPAELQRPHAAIIEAAESADVEVAIITFGRHSSEAFDRHIERDFELCPDEEALLTAVSREFHKRGKRVVVVLNICGPVEIASWRDKADAILCCWMPGQEGGNSVADVLLGRVSPSGKLPMSFPMRYDDVRSSKDFPRNVPENGLNQSRFNISTVGKIYDVKNIDYTNYVEDIYVGYRDYATRGVEVAYPFGFGLTYSTFEMSDMRVSERGKSFEVSCRVTNTGRRAAKQVVQLYSTQLAPEEDRPAIELRGYAKTPELQPGASCEVTIVVPRDELSVFSMKDGAWKLCKGDYRLSLGFDSSTRPLQQTVTIRKEELRRVPTAGFIPASGEVFVQ
ncbi:MAG: glycoside hydrolase family 3 C-terminal domain-containing protein [Alistipes sp.]|nr:glycoside hydrolase family 3 C-terminal domain-containing protein [Alistipes sp.]